MGTPYYAASVDGILSHSVRDAAGLLDVYVGMHDADAVVVGTTVAAVVRHVYDADPGRLRVAVTTSFLFGEVTDVCADAARAVATSPRGARP